MRFVAGRSAAGDGAKRKSVRKSCRSAPRGDTGTKIRRCGSIGKQLLTCRDASADWQGRGGEPSGRCCRQGTLQQHREAVAGRARGTARRKEPWPNDNNIAPIARSNRGYERISQLVLMAYSMENSNVLSYSLKMDILTVLLVRLKTSDHCVNPVES